MKHIEWRWGAVLLVAASSTLLVTGCGGDSEDPPAQTADLTRVLAYDRPDTYQMLSFQDVLVPMRDGFNLTCDVHRPASSTGVAAPGRFPSILANFTSYGRRSLAVGNDVRNFANKGYVVVWCNTRGSNGYLSADPAPLSVGQVSPWSPRDQQDNHDLIEWMAAQSWSTGNVGQIGTSYGALSTYLVAGNYPSSHLKAIIPIMGSPNLYADFATQNGIVRPTTGDDARNAWVPNCSVMTGEATCSDRLPGEWAAHPLYDDYWSGRSTDPLAIRIPTLSIGGFQDFWVSGLDRVHSGANEKDGFAMMIGPWPHGMPEAMERNPLPKGVYLAWFDRYVAGSVDAPLLPKASIQGVQDAPSNGWHQYSTWPPSESLPRKYHLTATGILQAQEPSAATSGYVVQADDSSASATYSTPTFTQSTVLVGQVRVTITAAFSSSDGHVIAEIWDRAPDGARTKTGFAGYVRASHRQSDSALDVVMPNVPYRLTLTIPSKHWTFAAGHSMELVLTSSDNHVGSTAPAGTVTFSSGPDSSFLEGNFK